MQKFLIGLIIFLSLIMQVPSANASDADYSNITKSPQIMAALDTLKGTKAEWVINTLNGDNASHRPVTVMFRNLEIMNPAYVTYEALTCLDSSDKIYIFINTKHKNAPPEAIAALLSHEALHQDSEDSIAEETKAWTNEAITWNEFLNKNPQLSDSSLSDIPLVKRLNTLDSIYIRGGVEAIRNKVASNPAYEGMNNASAGF